MITAEEFLDILEERELVSGDLVANLRGQVTMAAKLGKRISATVVAKRLIEKGEITRAQAKRILEAAAKAKPASAPVEEEEEFADESELELLPMDEAPSDRAEAAAEEETIPLEPIDEGPAKPAEGKPPREEAKTADTDELELMPLDDEPRRKPAAPARPKPAEPTPTRPAPPAKKDTDELELMPLDDEPRRKPSAPKPAAPKPAPPKPKPAEPAAARPKPPQPAPPKPKPPERAPAKPAPPAKTEEEELELVPLEEAKRPAQAPPKPEPPGQKAPAKEVPAPRPAPKPSPPQPEPGEEEEIELEPLEEAPRRKPAAPQRREAPAPRPAQKPAPAPRPPEKKPAPAATGAASLLDDEFGGGAGDLDGFMGAAALDAAAADAGTTLAPVAPRKKGWWPFGKRKGAKKAKENVWDSPLLLIGGGALIALLLIGAVLLFFIRREGGDQLFELAEDDYLAGSYNRAIEKYDEFLADFPEHRQASRARVHRGMAQLWRDLGAAGSGSNWGEFVASAKGLVDEISIEEDFGQSRKDVGAFWAETAKRLLEAAGTDPDKVDPELVAAGKEAVFEGRKHDGPKEDLSQADSELATLELRIQRGAKLDETIAAMKAAAEAGQPDDAYNARAEFLTLYPRAEQDAGVKEVLDEAMLMVCRAQQERVKVVRRDREAETAEPESPVLAGFAPARQWAAGAAEGAAGKVALARGQGAVYGLAAEDGKLLWRRYVGFADDGQQPPFTPMIVPGQTPPAAILVDASRNEVVRVRADDGKLVWRFPVAGRFNAHPVREGDHLLVASRAGRLVTIDLATGNSPQYVELHQELTVAPAVDSSRSQIYQLASRYNLYVLSTDDYQCKEVVYLGHEEGSVTVPPAIVEGVVVVAEKNRYAGSSLRILVPEQDGLREVQTEALEGHVDVPPVVFERRMLVVTDKGRAYVFEMNPADPERPLTRVGPVKVIPGGTNVVRYPLLQSTEFWLAGDRLIKYEIRVSEGDLRAVWTNDDMVGEAKCAFVQPPLAIGQSVFHVRREPGLDGILVAADAIESGKRLWETHLGAPLAAAPEVDAQSGQITAVTTSGAVFALGGDAIQSDGVGNTPVATVAPETGEPRAEAVKAVVPVRDGLVAMPAAVGSRRIAVLEHPQAAAWSWVGAFDVPGPIACTPVPFADGLLVAKDAPRPGSGAAAAPVDPAAEVMLMDPRTGKRKLMPFQPRLEPGTAPQWRALAAAGNDAALAADSKARLFWIRVEDQPEPHLVADPPEGADLPAAVASPIAVLGEKACFVDENDKLQAVALPDLTATEIAALGGPCVWGPHQVGGRAMLAAPGRLVCVEPDGRIGWELPLDPSDGPPVGKPLELEDGYLLTLARGKVCRIRVEAPAPSAEETAEAAKTAAADAASPKAQVIAQTDLGRPLAGGAAQLGDRLIVGGHDGTLYVTAMPEAASSEPEKVEN